MYIYIAEISELQWLSIHPRERQKTKGGSGKKQQFKSYNSYNYIFQTLVGPCLWAVIQGPSIIWSAARCRHRISCALHHGGEHRGTRWTIPENQVDPAWIGQKFLPGFEMVCFPGNRLAYFPYHPGKANIVSWDWNAALAHRTTACHLAGKVAGLQPFFLVPAGQCWQTLLVKIDIGSSVIGQNPATLVKTKIAAKWIFIPLNGDVFDLLHPHIIIYILINRANSWQMWSLSICNLLVSTRPTQHSQVSPSADIMPMARCSFKTSTRRSSPLISGFPSQMLREWSTNGTFKHSNWWDMLQPLLVGLQILTCKIWRLAQ